MKQNQSKENDTNFKQAIVDLWTFIHQPVEFNKLTYKKCGKHYKIHENSLLIHATKHPEIVDIGKKISKKINISNKEAYKIGMQFLVKEAYTYIRRNKTTNTYDNISRTEHRTRCSFKYKNHIVILVLDSDHTSKYYRKVTGVSCYFKNPDFK